MFTNLQLGNRQATSTPFQQGTGLTGETGAAAQAPRQSGRQAILPVSRKGLGVSELLLKLGQRFFPGVANRELMEIRELGLFPQRVAATDALTTFSDDRIFSHAAQVMMHSLRADADKMAQRTAVVMLDGSESADARQAAIQTGLADLESRGIAPGSERLMVIQLGTTPQDVAVSFYNHAGLLDGEREHAAARILSQEVLPRAIASGLANEPLDLSGMALLGQQGPVLGKGGAVRFGIIDPFTIAGAVTVGLGAASGVIYKIRASRAKAKSLKENVILVNDFLKAVGSQDKVNPQNIYSTQTIELFLSGTPNLTDTDKLDAMINLVWDNLPKDVQQKSETQSFIERIYLKKGVSHPSASVRKYFVGYLDKANDNARLYYEPFNEQLKHEKDPELAKELERILLKLVTHDDNVHIQACLALEENPFYQQFALKALCLPEVYDDTTLAFFLQRIPTVADATLLESMINIIVEKAKPEDAATMAGHLDSANARIKRTAIQVLMNSNEPAYFPRLWEQAKNDIPFNPDKTLPSLYQQALGTLFIPEHLSCLQDAVAQAQHPILQTIALKMLAEHRFDPQPQAVPILFNALENISAKGSQELVLKAIEKNVAPENRDLILGKLESTDQALRMGAVRSLCQVARPDDWQSIFKHYEKEPSEEIRTILASALNLQTNADTPESELLGLIRHPDPVLKAVALKGLKGKGIETIADTMAALNEVVEPSSKPKGGLPTTPLGKDMEALLLNNLIAIFLHPFGLRQGDGDVIGPQYDEEKTTLEHHLPVVRQGLSSHDKEVQNLCLDIVRAFEDVASIPTLFEILAKHTFGDEAALSKAIASLVDDSQFDLLLDKAKQPDPVVRMAAVKALAGMPLESKHLPPLMTMAETETDKPVAKLLNETIVSGLEQLKDLSDEVLEEEGGPLPVLYQGLACKDKGVQNAALDSVRHLEYYTATTAVPAMFKLLIQKSFGDEKSLKEAIVALVGIPHHPQLMGWARNPDRVVREAAAKALLELPLQGPHLPELMDLVKAETDPSVETVLDDIVLKLLNTLDETAAESGHGNSKTFMPTSMSTHADARSVLVSLWQQSGTEAAGSERAKLKILQYLIKTDPQDLLSLMLDFYGQEPDSRPRSAIKDWLQQALKTSDEFKTLPNGMALQNSLLMCALKLDNEALQSVAVDRILDQREDFFKNNPVLVKQLLDYLEAPTSRCKDRVVAILKKVKFEKNITPPPGQDQAAHAKQVAEQAEFETGMVRSLKEKLKSTDPETRYYAATLFSKFSTKEDIPLVLDVLDRESEPRIRQMIFEDLNSFRLSPVHFAVFSKALKTVQSKHAKLYMAQLLKRHLDDAMVDLADFYRDVLNQAASGELKDPDYLESVQNFFRQYLELVDKDRYQRQPITGQQAKSLLSLFNVQDAAVKDFAVKIFGRYRFSAVEAYPFKELLDALETGNLSAPQVQKLSMGILDKAHQGVGELFQKRVKSPSPQVKALSMRVLKKLEKAPEYQDLAKLLEPTADLTPDQRTDLVALLSNASVPEADIPGALALVKVVTEPDLRLPLLKAVCKSPRIQLADLIALLDNIPNGDIGDDSMVVAGSFAQVLLEQITDKIATTSKLPEIEQTLALQSPVLKRIYQRKNGKLMVPAQQLLHQAALTRLNGLTVPTEKLLELLLQFAKENEQSAAMDTCWQMIDNGIGTRTTEDEAMFYLNPLADAPGKYTRLNAIRLLRSPWRPQALSKMLSMLPGETDLDVKARLKEGIVAVASNKDSYPILLKAFLEMKEPGDIQALVEPLSCFGHEALMDLMKAYTPMLSAQNMTQEHLALRAKLESTILELLQRAPLSDITMLEVCLNSPNKAIQAQTLDSANAMNSVFRNGSAGVSPANYLTLLIEYLQSENCAHPDKALEILLKTNQADQEENHNYLLNLLTVDSPRVKLAAMEMVANGQRLSDLPALFRALTAEVAQSPFNKPVVDGLKKLIIKSTENPSILTPLVMELQEAAHPLVKQAAICALEKLGEDALPFLLETLDSVNPAAEGSEAKEAALIVPDLERAIVAIAAKSDESVPLLMDKLETSNKLCLRTVLLALSQCINRWDGLTERSEIATVMPWLEQMRGVANQLALKGQASKVFLKLKARIAPPPEPVV